MNALQDASLGEIRATAHRLAAARQPWHFHILTPTCSLNADSRFAFILEDDEGQQALVHYSDKMEQDLGAELSPLLHKVPVEGVAPAEAHKPSPQVRHILKRGRELNEQHVQWHHHVLFPGCRYNQNSPKFTLSFEDPVKHVTLEQMTDTEPTSDLRLLEPLFYQQRKK